MDKIFVGEIINKNTSVLILSVLLLIIFSVPPLSGELSASAKEAELFEKAYEYYISYRPDKALEFFDRFLNKFPDSSAQDSALFWKAKSLIQLNEKDKAAEIFSRIKEQFPESPFRGFAEKELENIGKTEPFTVKTKEVREKNTVKKPDTDVGVLTQTLKQVASDYEQKIKLLKEEKRVLEKQLSEFHEKTQLTEKGLSRAIDDRNTLEETIEKEKKKNEELSKRLVRAKTVEAVKIKLLEENRLLKANLKQTVAAQKQLEAELAGIQDKGKIHQKKSKETIEAAKLKLLEENRLLKARLKQTVAAQKQLEAELAAIQDKGKIHQKKTKETIETVKMKLLEENRLLKARFKESDTAQKRLEVALRAVQIERKTLQEKIKEIRNKEKEKKDVTRWTFLKLSEKIQEQEKRYKESAVLIKGLTEEKASLISVLKEAERSARNSNSNEASDRLKGEHEKLKKAYDALIKENKERDSELALSKDRVKQYQAAALKIKKESAVLIKGLTEEKASLISVLKETERSARNSNSNEASDRLKGEHEKLKKAYDALYNALVKENKKKDSELALPKDRLKQHEAAALFIDEKEIRNYYETNKKEYLVSSGEKSAKILSMEYTSKDELDKALLAVEFQSAAMDGKSFENIYKSRPDMLVLKQLKSAELPIWIKKKIEGLKDGEISNVISADNQFIILQIQLKNPVYSKYKDVHTEIEKILLSKKRAYCQGSGALPVEIKRKAEDIK